MSGLTLWELFKLNAQTGVAILGRIWWVLLIFCLGFIITTIWLDRRKR